MYHQGKVCFETNCAGEPYECSNNVAWSLTRGKLLITSLGKRRALKRATKEKKKKSERKKERRNRPPAG